MRAALSLCALLVFQFTLVISRSSHLWSYVLRDGVGAVDESLLVVRQETQHAFKYPIDQRRCPEYQGKETVEVGLQSDQVPSLAQKSLVSSRTKATSNQPVLQSFGAEERYPTVRLPQCVG